ncbi:phage holin family protein [Sulfobacillus sp. hq2]|uniref:phage holin family protein n=1 Tax=Sulfobacillus TaxID=28033 RepID=UPI001304A609|nr:phage holin family protein [Sulfobacillus sp. hq2]
MNYLGQVLAVVKADAAEFWTLLGLIALDFVVGTGKALLTKRFSSAAFRRTLSKTLDEIGLPVLVALLSIVEPSLRVVVPIALWLGIITEATSVLEHVRGKTGSTTETLVELIKDYLPTLANLERVLHIPNASTTPTDTTSDTKEGETHG